MRRLAVLLALAVLVPAASASAADRYVVAAGGSTDDPDCTVDVPCTLTHAVEDVAAAGDVVLVGAGSYAFVAASGHDAVEVDEAITIRPRGDGLVVLESSDVSPLLRVSASARIERLGLSGPGTPLELDGGGPAVINTAVVATGPNPAIRALGTSAARLLHVTAVSEGVALSVAGNGTLTARNSILRGGGATDVDADPSDVGFDHTAVRGFPGTGNVTADPLLGVSLVPSAGSPVIDAGVADADAGEVDMLGQQRVSRCALPDLGAIEVQASCPPPPDDGDGDGDGGDGGQTPPPPPPAGGGQQPPPVVQRPTVVLKGLLEGDFTDPTLGRLRVTASKKRRLTARLTASEGVLVRFVIEKRVDGRRQGSSCVRGAKKGRRCTRWVVVRRVSRSIRSGSARVTLGGALRPGTYRVSARGQDAWRNTSAREVATVRVKRG